jgi:hypothetical protein
MAGILRNAARPAVRVAAVGCLVFIELGCSDHASTQPPESGLWITGKIQDLGGRPIKGAEAIVWLASTDPNNTRPHRVVATTDRKGAFMLPVEPLPTPAPDEPPPEPPRIRFERDGYVDASAQPKWPDAKNRVMDVGIVGMAVEARIVGVVEGGPFDPADTTRIIAVRAGDPNEMASAGINEKGEFRLVGLAPGRYRIAARDDLQWERECDVSADAGPFDGAGIDLAEGKVVTVRVRIGAVIPNENERAPKAANRTFIGKFLSLGNRPMAGARVAVHRLDQSFVTVVDTDAAGTFTIEDVGADEELGIIAILGDQVLARKRARVDDPNEFVIRPEGQPTRPAVVIRLRDRVTSLPILSAKFNSLVMTGHYGYTDPHKIPGREPVSEPQQTEPGLYRVPYLPWGAGFFAVRVSAPGLASVHTTELSNGLCEDIGPFGFDLSPPGTLIGQLVGDDNGGPMIGVHAKLLEPGNDDPFLFSLLMNRSIETGIDGTFRIDDLNVGTYTLLVHATPGSSQDATPSIEIVGGKTNKTIFTAPVASELGVDVYDRDGKPAQKARISVTMDGRPNNWKPVEVVAGRFVLRTNDVGPCRVTAWGENIDAAGISAEAEIRRDARTKVVIRQPK